MPTIFTAPDGAQLAHHRLGDGPPLVCLPGGPMRASEYLGDLGGLAAHRTLVKLDLRGTGASARPADPATYRCDRQVGDVEALRRHLGLDRIDLLAHSAAGDIATRYAAEHPERVGRLVLVTARSRTVGIQFTDQDRRDAAERRRHEPWGEAALEALVRIQAGGDSEEDWDAIQPLFYGRWDDAARAHAATGEAQSNEDAGEVYAADGAFDPDRTAAALRGLTAPVLVLAGEHDGGPTPQRAAAFAEAFPVGRLAVLPRAGHFPWLDDPAGFVATVRAFLDGE